MRARLGRPDLARYADRFDVPEAEGAFATTFLGVSTVLVDDGETALLTDGYFSRPSMGRVLLGRLAPDDARIDAALRRAGIDQLAVVAPVHTHFDHALDSPAVVRRTGAVLAGGSSAAHIGRGSGLPEDRILEVVPGEPHSFGSFTLTWLESEHCPPDRYPGTIDAPVVPPTRAGAYRCGEAWSILVEHTSGRTALIQGSAGFRAGALSGRKADVVYLGVGQLGVQDRDYLRTYWAETVEATGASEVVLLHWDDFFRPLHLPLRALPYAGDDLDVTMEVLTDLARRQRVGLHLPTLWRREDPWAISPR
ncbi:L-ascorbate metabolism protein UlaG (beta-lactamase superfamily) [Nocardioides aromaticivorans]|uniref:L-ascorbate metabolism protein UlaG (Beta-lactamase superfamily) n=1 Tax=Nocardioides aromaticivorans TaxID=200618 RepID=A0A7Z0CJN7_9ACTN|nr:MBL fold metallo-hydrolase [Nocardioides aromaticivorans]NYI43229.1 L-ascorbate metabolism protein UlaG (beta-lactamase superfamily) [Nocardioides aromaticivorans]